MTKGEGAWQATDQFQHPAAPIGSNSQTLQPNQELWVTSAKQDLRPNLQNQSPSAIGIASARTHRPLASPRSKPGGRRHIASPSLPDELMRRLRQSLRKSRSVWRRSLPLSSAIAAGGNPHGIWRISRFVFFSAFLTNKGRTVSFS
ncbi:unnamed protein product, partial [Cuscuta epithymum]